MFLFLDVLKAVKFQRALLVSEVDFGRRFLDWFIEVARTNDILEILKQALLVLRLALRRHLCDRLDFALQDQEALVVKINTVGTEERANLAESRLAPVDRVN